MVYRGISDWLGLVTIGSGFMVLRPFWFNYFSGGDYLGLVIISVEWVLGFCGYLGSGFIGLAGV